MGAHAKFSPSGASIWVNCPGALVLQDTAPDGTSEHAERGTAAHELLELKLTGRATPVGHKMSNGIVLDEEDLAAVNIAVDYINDQVEDGDEWETETRHQFNDDLWGTIDFSRYRPSTKALLLADYKHGAGVLVEAVGNLQGTCYSMMKAKSLGNRGISEITFAIIQPRCDQGQDELIREATYNPTELFDWEDLILSAMQKSKEATDAYADALLGGKAEMDAWIDKYVVRGDHCRFCKANYAGGCPKVTAELHAAAELDFFDEKTFDKIALADALSICGRASDAIKSTLRFAEQQLKLGTEIPGWKLVETRPSTKWANEGKARALVQNKTELSADKFMTEPQFKSYAQVRDALADHMPGKTKKARKEAAASFLSDVTTTSSSGVKLAPESNPAPAVNKSPEADFAAID
jgi:hypothetical protein